MALARRADVDEASATARARVSALGEELHIIAERRDAASAWLDAHSADAPLASQWPRWEALLSRAASLVSNRLTLLEQRPALRDALTAAEDLAQTAEESAHRAEDSLRSAERLNADLEAEAARALGGRPPRLDKEALDERRVTLAQLRAVLRRACDAQTANARARLEEASAREEIEAAAVEVAAGKSAAERTGAALAEAERALEGARVALGLEERRHDLHDGDPCPLCGAREHPYADELPPFSRLVRDLDDRVHGLRAELTSQRESAQGARVRGDLARTKALTARQRALTAEEEQRGAEELWLDLGFKLGWQAGQELPAPWDAAAVAVLDRIEGETNEQLARVRELLARQSEAAARVANRGQVNGEAQERSSTAQRELTAARHRLDLLEQRLFDQVDVERRLRAELDEAFTASDWWEELSADPQGFTLRCRSAQERYCVHQRTRAETDAAHQALSAESESAQARAVEFEAARGVAHEELTAQQRILERHRAARARCLEGRAVDQVQAELEREQLTSRDGLQAAARLATAAREESSAASARREVALSQLERCQLAAREAEAALLEALANCEQPISAVRERLARGESWLQGERRALERLALRRAELDKTVDVYASQRDEHQARGRPAQDHAAAESSLAEASEAEALAEQALLAVEARLTSDDRVVKTARSLTRRRDEQREQSALWEVMGDLIGSHDGKKFRVFAQSLTLELLLQWANRTLAELAPRYQLQRVAGQDLDLQVADLDMAGEVRPISSLSGGESFLISLALALGLSSLSAHDARVDSLFVDEGFGTLDPESQEVALATLDALQASGRQVVLISHVPGLGERIGAGIRVVPQGQGCSKVRLASA